MRHAWHHGPIYTFTLTTCPRAMNLITNAALGRHACRLHAPVALQPSLKGHLALNFSASIGSSF